jgi:DNA-binding helix-hairpin-helix protein with protein kinase domain
MPVQTKTRPALLDQTGRPVALGQQLGSGGEGAVFEVRDRPELVAKLYHHPLDPKKAAKIAAMTTTKTERLIKLTAWPVEVICDSNRSVVGFLMPKLSGHKVAFNLYSPKLRLQHFQNASWQFLIRTATNAALSFNVIHEHGHVIGDVNHGNLFVSDRATVRLIDCDSYQITIDGTRWFCEVGVPTHQPPEMQNLKTYKGHIRSPNHDNFGLAVIIFQMLFMARHPFSGRFLGTGEMPMERAISEYRFAYSANPVQMQPPPASLGLNGVTPQVAQLFERAFSSRGTQQGRPTACDWVAALQDLEKHLKKCSINASHQFVDSLSSCPWCHIEAATGVPLFPVVLVGPTQSGFSILSFWAKVSAVPNPGPPPPLPRTEGMSAPPSAEALELQRSTFGARLKAGFLTFLGAPNRIQTLKQKIEAQTIAARTRWRNFQGNWNNYAGSKEFQDILAHLQSLRSQYEALPQKRLQALQKLEANLYSTQLHAHLDRCRIANARIKGVGPAKKITLQSYGIETAADITEQRVLGVPGFGPVLASTLAQWRYQQERRFVFDPKKGVDPAAKNAVERQILTERVDLERKLNEGLSKLIVSSHHITTRRQKLMRDAEEIAHEFVQAEADLRVASAVSAIVPGRRAVITIGAVTIGGAIIASGVGKAPSIAPAPTYQPARTQPVMTATPTP